MEKEKQNQTQPWLLWLHYKHPWSDTAIATNAKFRTIRLKIDQKKYLSHRAAKWSHFSTGQRDAQKKLHLLDQCETFVVPTSSRIWSEFKNIYLVLIPDQYHYTRTKTKSSYWKYKLPFTIKTSSSIKTAFSSSLSSSQRDISNHSLHEPLFKQVKHRLKHQPMEPPVSH